MMTSEWRLEGNEGENPEQYVNMYKGPEAQGDLEAWGVARRPV